MIELAKDLKGFFCLSSRRSTRALRKVGLRVVASRSAAYNGVSGINARLCGGTEVNASLGHLIPLVVRRNVRNLVRVGLIESGLKWLLVLEIVWRCVVLVVMMRVDLAGIAFDFRQCSRHNATSK